MVSFGLEIDVVLMWLVVIVYVLDVGGDLVFEVVGLEVVMLGVCECLVDDDVLLVEMSVVFDFFYVYFLCDVVGNNDKIV